MIPLAFFLGIAIWMNGSTVAAIQGRWARQLDLPGAGLIPYAPGVALAFFVLAVIAIIRFKVRWRWASFFGANLLATFISGYPFLLLGQAEGIPLSAPLTRESKQAIEERFSVKWVSDGRNVLVRRDGYSAELAAFVTGLVEHQAEKSSGSGH